ncbi:copper-binding protein [Sphingomonas sp. HDW15A]|uniref:cupredoxin domain-containing protein n=1 Tax=Sphingomonas sp. HDW15A TaxID=2714942 RepID=UPI001407CA73|nr:cupredoxin domain-containing protein [Sphingomonas sp. HDW15A]QIK96504.1 copper-binding protein [Sphingomonas sp. HDW15A]
MRLPLLLVSALLFAVPLGAQPVDWSNAKVVDVELSNYAFSPTTLTLQHGVPYRLHIVNKAGGSHNFLARTFFAQATLDPSSSAVVKKGGVELGGGESADVRLIAPQPGTFDVHCSHFMHSSFGMKGTIVVQ